MSDLEKDIKFIEKMIKEYKTFGDLHNPDYEDTERIYKALENILSAYRNSIPKQKVKDEIEELKKHYNTDNNIRIYTLKDSYELQATILEELLEDK